MPTERQIHAPTYIAADNIVETGETLGDDAIMQIVSDVPNDILSDNCDDDNDDSDTGEMIFKNVNLKMDFRWH